jgi:DNA invertase Pin-like site-specific DNA recombinase
MTYASILTRVSNPEHEDGYSLPEQEKDAGRYAAEMGYTILPQHVWNDGVQKSYMLKRPGLQAAMEAIRNGEIHVLVVGRYDRFSRIQMQQAIAIYQIEELYGGRVESADKNEQFGKNSTGA